MFNLKKGGIDIIVGLPSYNEADNIRFVTQQVDQGLQKYYPDLNSLIINIDNNSPDKTKTVFLKTETKTKKKYITTPEGVVGKGNNFFNLFKEVKQRQPKVCLVVDTDLKSIKPDWVHKLIQPILSKQAEYVLPIYSRNEYDGTITNNLCYPLLYGVLGCNIRQPIAGEFAFSARLNDYWLDQQWQPSTYQYGIDIFMTLNAILGDFPIVQVCLGSKVHKPSAPKLGPMFTQVISTMLGSILANKNFWLKNKKLYTPPIFYNDKNSEPQPLSVDYKSIKKTARAGFEQYQNFYKQIFPHDLFARLIKSYQLNNINIDKEDWVQILFYFLKAANQPEFGQQTVESLKPLYFARVDSFIRYTLDMDYKDSEREIVSQAELCFRHRADLIKLFK